MNVKSKTDLADTVSNKMKTAEYLPGSDPDEEVPKEKSKLDETTTDAESNNGDPKG